MTLHERTKVLSCLLNLLRDCCNNQGRIAVITGAVGTGKTEVVHALSREAIAANAIHCEATASRAEQTLQFGVISQLFLSPELPQDIREQAARLLEVGAITAQIGYPDASDASTCSSPTYIAHALSALLVDVTESTARPLLIALDDIHHADPASLQCLSSIIGRLRRARAMVVICATTEWQSFSPTFLSCLPAEPFCRHIKLDILTERGVKAMLAEQFPNNAAEELAVACHGISGGNPIMVRGLMEDYRRFARETAPKKLTIGPETIRAFLGILHRCDFSMLNLARCLAILGESASPAVAGQLAALDCESATRALTALRNTGSLDTLCSGYPELRAALLDGLAPEERAAMHARAAELLRIEGASTPVIAHQLLFAEQAEWDWAVPLLNDAAVEALADGEVCHALRYLRVAHRLPACASERAVTQSLLARAKWRIDPSLTMRYSTDVIAGIQSGGIAGQDALAWVGRLMWFGRAEEAREALRCVSAMRDTLDQASNSYLDALQIRLSYIFPATCEPGRMQRPVPQNPTVPRYVAGPLAADPELQAISLLASTLADGAGESTIAAEHILEESTLDEQTLGLLIAALGTLMFSGQFGTADFWCDSLQKTAAAREAPTWRAMFAAVQAIIALRQGNLAIAESQARMALALIPARSWGIGVVVPLSVLVRVTTVTGRYKEAFGHLRTPLPSALFETPLCLAYLQARGRFHYMREDFHTALRDFQSIADLMTDWNMDLPALVSWRSDIALVYLRLGRNQQAHDLAMEQLKMLTPRQARERGISLRVLAACEEPPKRLIRLDEAVEQLEKSGDRLELAHTLAELGKAYHALGEISEARKIRGRAHQIAKQGGATILDSSLLPDADKIPGPQPASGSSHAGQGRTRNLSDAERRVAVLAADGYSNSQIAGKLFVTVSTVEQHLTRVYSKLKLNSRSELPSGLHNEISDLMLTESISSCFGVADLQYVNGFASWCAPPVAGQRGTRRNDPVQP